MFDFADLMLDAWLLSDLMDGPNLLPNRHKISMSPEQIHRGIETILERLQHDTNTPAPTLDSPKMRAARAAVGSQAWAEVVGQIHRLRDIVGQAVAGLSPQEIQAVQASDGARALLTEYVQLANHAALPKADPALAKPLLDALPELSRRIGAVGRGTTNPGTMHDLLRQTVKDPALHEALDSARQLARVPRVISQSYFTAFSNGSNFKTSLGSALRFRDMGTSVLFYSGALATASAVWECFRPSRQENGEKRHDWTAVTLTAAGGVAAMLGAVMIAGRSITAVGK